MPPDVHCPAAPICMWAATLAGSEHERAIRADQRRLNAREIDHLRRALAKANETIVEQGRQLKRAHEVLREANKARKSA